MSQVRAKRTDIQALRAVAVLLVVIYHLWPARITGGYVGVDVFFVISGFLITSHLLDEVDHTGTVSVTRFWARRVKRLLPAAFTVLGASLLAAFLLLPRSGLGQALLEIGASTLYVLNWILSANSIDYLAADNQPSLVQHYWSLAVEEQFYAVWPLLFIAAMWITAKLVKSAATPSGRRISIAVVLLLVFAASLLFSIVETARSQQSAYFITTTRVWEFAAGGLLAVLPAFLRAENVGTWLRTVLSWTGFGLIVGSALTFDSSTAFPGHLALLPVVGTALIIYTGENSSPWSLEYLAPFKPVQFVGDVSYSISGTGLSSFSSPTSSVTN